MVTKNSSIVVTSHVVHGTSEEVAKNEHWKLESPGVSRHSEGYLCTVKEAGVTGGRGLREGVGTMWL